MSPVQGCKRKVVKKHIQHRLYFFVSSDSFVIFKKCMARGSEFSLGGAAPS